MRCRTQCSDNYFESPKRVESKFHKPSRSEDFYFVNQAPSILSSYQNLSKVASIYLSIELSKITTISSHPCSRSNNIIDIANAIWLLKRISLMVFYYDLFLIVSANSVNYSSVHELSVLLENEREQH